MQESQERRMFEFTNCRQYGGNECNDRHFFCSSRPRRRGHSYEHEHKGNTAASALRCCAEIQSVRTISMRAGTLVGVKS